MICLRSKCENFARFTPFCLRANGNNGHTCKFSEVLHLAVMNSCKKRESQKFSDRAEVPLINVQVRT